MRFTPKKALCCEQGMTYSNTFQSVYFKMAWPWVEQYTATVCTVCVSERLVRTESWGQIGNWWDTAVILQKVCTLLSNNDSWYSGMLWGHTNMVNSIITSSINPHHKQIKDWFEVWWNREHVCFYQCGMLNWGSCACLRSSVYWAMQCRGPAIHL